MLPTGGEGDRPPATAGGEGRSKSWLLNQMDAENNGSRMALPQDYGALSRSEREATAADLRSPVENGAAFTATSSPTASENNSRSPGSQGNRGLRRTHPRVLAVNRVAPHCAEDN